MKSALLNYIVNEWFERARELGPGERLHIPVVSKSDLKRMKSEMEKLRRGLGLVDPETSHALVIGDLFTREDGGRLWITVTKRLDSPLRGYVTKPGEVYRVDINPSSRKRMLLLMARDGYSRDQVEEVIGPLDEEEVEEFF